MGGDALVEVAFDSVGTKKLMLKMAAEHLKIVYWEYTLHTLEENIYGSWLRF